MSESFTIPVENDERPPAVDEVKEIPAEIAAEFSDHVGILDVQAIEQDMKLLPAYYKEGFSNFMKRAQSLDRAHFHHWVNVNKYNQHMKKWKGWEPVEDKALLEKLGLGTLLNSRNRAQHMDVELWRMPRAVGLAVRRAIARKGARRSQSLREGLEAMAEDTRGRSKGKAVPFMSTQQIRTDVRDRIPTSPAPKPTQ